MPCRPCASVRVETRITTLRHYNFRNLPLEIFDHAEDFEVKTPQEWMEEAQLGLR